MCFYSQLFGPCLTSGDEGSNAYVGVHPELIEAVAAGKLTGVEELITRKIDLEDVVDQGILALVNEKDKHGEILTLSWQLDIS